MKLPILFSRLAQPPPPPIKRRRRDFGTFAGTINPQKSSPFLSHLPAEIRNEIYFYVFVVDPPFSIDPNHVTDHHPLSLLLTCRLINSEASVLAFRVHTFHLSGDISFHGLRLRTTCLPNVLFDNISSVSCMPWPYWRYPMSAKKTVDVLASIVLFLPTLQTLNVKAYSAGQRTEAWIKDALDGIVQLKHGNWRMVEPDGMDVEGESTSARCERIGRSGKPRVHVVEEEDSGRRVRVVVEAGGCANTDAPGMDWDSPGLGRFGMILKVVGRNENVREVTWKSGKTGFEYDPGDEYWADLRNRRIYERKGEVDRGRDEELPGF